MSGVRAVVKTAEEYRAWSDAAGPGGRVAFIAEHGETPVLVYPGGQFLWVCPGCGGGTLGTFGAEPVSGWDSPRWTREGDDEHLTLTPSLGCPRWRDGTCSGGHYWLRDGELVPA
jgi:hypothetical protein